MGGNGEESPIAIDVVKVMFKKQVVGSHHKQAQTIAGWFATHDRGRVKAVLDEMASDPTEPIHKKGRGTFQLTSMADAEAWLAEQGEAPPDVWWD